jgi:hypothetical protein
MEKLTAAEIKILDKEVATASASQRIFGIAAFVLVALLAVCLYLKWEFPAPFFIGALAAFLVVISIIQHFSYRKVAADRAKGVSTILEGVIAKKEMKTGYNTYSTDDTKESLEELAKYIEDKAKGVGKDQGVLEWNLSKAAQASFLITLADGSCHGVSIREYIDLNIQDKVRIKLTPLSKTFLHLSKL